MIREVTWIAVTIFVVKLRTIIVDGVIDLYVTRERFSVRTFRDPCTPPTVVIRTRCLLFCLVALLSLHGLFPVHIYCLDPKLGFHGLGLTYL